MSSNRNPAPVLAAMCVAVWVAMIIGIIISANPGEPQLPPNPYICQSLQPGYVAVFTNNETKPEGIYAISGGHTCFYKDGPDTGPEPSTLILNETNGGILSFEGPDQYIFSFDPIKYKDGKIHEENSRGISNRFVGSGYGSVRK